jgi:branched-chain amino acid transport system substrate-binding protein
MAVLASACASSAKDSSSSNRTPSSGDVPAATGAAFKGQSAAEANTIIDGLVGPIKQVDGNTTRGVTRDQITLESVTALKSAAGTEPFPGQCEGTQARLDRANREGGVNGRKIRWLGCKDDGSDRARNRQLVQAAVEEDGAFALLPVLSQGFFSEDYLNEKHVPYLGYGFQPGYCGYNRPFAFGTTFTACSPDALADHGMSIPGEYLALAAATGKKDFSGVRAVAVSQDSAASRASSRLVSQSLRDAGADVAATLSNIPGPPAPTVTDFTPYVNEIMSNNPGLVVMALSMENQLGVTSGLKAAGFTGTVAGFNFSDSRIFASDRVLAAVDGTYQINVGVGNAVFGGPTFDQIRKDLDASGFGGVPVSNAAIHGYAAADMFLDVLKKTPEPVTTEAFANTINRGYQYPGLGNAACKKDWPLGHYGGPFCYSVVKIDKSKKDFTPALDLKEYPFAVTATS